MSSHPTSKIRFGAAYYAEYSPVPRLAQDLELMSAAAFSVIRVGESVWSTWEPNEGVFDLDWLEPVLDGAHEHGIEVILGTPTYAIPPWMARRYPEIMAERTTGGPIPFGHRQNVDFSHPAFLFHAERVIRRVVERYADHPAVIGYQLDNEPGVELFHNRGSFEGFVESLRETYGDVEALNERWGLTYWSHRLSRWSDLWTPDGNTTPAYDLAWRRYQARLTTQFIAWQADIVRGLGRDGQFVTTCLSLHRPALDAVELMGGLDVTAANLYYPMQDGLALPSPVDNGVGRPQWLADAGTWSLYLQSDTARGVRQEPFLVTETDANSIGESHVNFGAYDGQWRQAIWSLVSRGARMVEYWHWHSNHFGNETYWGGVLGHSLEPGRCYDELARTGAELAATGDRLSALVPDEDVAFLVSPESRWALEFQPPLAVEGTNAPDHASYDRVLTTLYRGFFEAGLQAAIVHPDQLGTDAAALVERWPVLVVPALYIASDELLQLLVEYAAAGGHLVTTFRTGYADLDARPRAEVMPGVLAPAVGATYLEYTNLAAPVTTEVVDGSGLEVSGGQATGWADALVLDGARALATYDHPHLSRWPAVTTHAHSEGHVTYLGTLPNAPLALELARWVSRASLAQHPWRAMAATVTSTSGRTPEGQVWFVSNWSWEPVTITVPEEVEELFSRETIGSGEQLALGAWDVKILLRREDASSR